jgi:hypothetical protein
MMAETGSAILLDRRTDEPAALKIWETVADPVNRLDIGKIEPSKHEPKNKTITLADKWLKKE